jgi:addiction module HigA family antidote
MDTDTDSLAFRPPHPGEILREDILPSLNMQVKELANHLGVSRQTLSSLVHERRGVSLDMARRLGKAFHNGPRYWLALQTQWEIWQEEQKNVAVDVLPLNWKTDAA